MYDFSKICKIRGWGPCVAAFLQYQMIFQKASKDPELPNLIWTTFTNLWRASLDPRLYFQTVVVLSILDHYAFFSGSIFLQTSNDSIRCSRWIPHESMGPKIHSDQCDNVQLHGHLRNNKMIIYMT
mgnify:CR=1 FL=1